MRTGNTGILNVWFVMVEAQVELINNLPLSSQLRAELLRALVPP